MLELEVVPEHGLISDVVEFILGKSFVKSFSLTFRKFKYTCLVKQRAPQTLFCTQGHLSSKGIVLLKLEIFFCLTKKIKSNLKMIVFNLTEFFQECTSARQWLPSNPLLAVSRESKYYTVIRYDLHETIIDFT